MDEDFIHSVRSQLAIRGKHSDQRTAVEALDAFNVLNTINDTNYVGVITSPLFGQPVSAAPPRQLQLSARIKF